MQSHVGLRFLVEDTGRKGQVTFVCANSSGTSRTSLLQGALYPMITESNGLQGFEDIWTFCG